MKLTIAFPLLVLLVLPALAQQIQVFDTNWQNNGNSWATTVLAPGLPCIAGSGSSTAYTCTTSPKTVPSAGMVLNFRVDVTGGASPTLNVNSSSAAEILKVGGSVALVANDLLAGQWVTLIFDGTNWQMQGQLGNVGGGMTWPTTPGIALCTGTPCTAWGTSLAETDGDVIQGASGAWTVKYPAQTYVQASLTGSNVTMTSTTGTFYDGPSTGSIVAGTWLVSGYVTLGKASATAQALDQCKLWDGTTTFATAEASIPYVTTAAITYNTLHLVSVVTEASSATIKISCETSVGSGIIYYQTPTSSLANASSISAVRIQ